MENICPSLIRDCMGWSKDAWAKPFIETLHKKELSFKGINFIEIGAGKYSSLSPFFLHCGAHVTCSYYNEDILNDLKENNDLLIQKYDIEGKINYERKDLFYLNNKYDVILMKSVLGGVFREKASSIDEIEEFIRYLINKNLNKNGYLFLLDNGSSIFENFLENLGSRKNRWRFFKINQLKNFNFQESFGFSSAFALEFRLKFLGKFLEKILYYFDLIVCKFYKKNPTVIVSLFKK
mgnify:CR=1 FL=1|tara:strand:+ start:16759 stop:17466 length:708 start_codon:yes stop_codon:yes gene_type:complete